MTQSLLLPGNCLPEIYTPLSELILFIYKKEDYNMKTTTNCTKKTATFQFILFILNFMIFSKTAFSQIEGRVTDTLNNPVAYANVLLINPADSSLITGTISNDNGIYNLINTSAGEYLLNVCILGYKPYYSKVFVITGSNNNQVMNPIRMVEEAQELAGVNITAKKPLYEMQIDRMVVNLENSLSSKGMSVLEVLEKSPGVAVDKQRNTLSLIGKEGVKLMINGRINNMPVADVIQMLEAMSSEEVKKIELITAPPAKYDAEGDAGIINLVLKKNLNTGTNGSYMLGAEMGARGKLNGNLSLNHRKERINYYLNYNSSFRASRYMIQSNRITEEDGSIYESRTKSTHTPETFFNSIRTGIDYDLSDKTLLGVMFSGYIIDYEGHFINNTIKKKDDEIESRLNLNAKGPSNSFYALSNFNIQHSFKEDEILSFNFDYLDYYRVNPIYYIQDTNVGTDNSYVGDEIDTKKHSPLKISVGKIDYNRQIGSSLQLEAGLKGTINRFRNDVSVSYLNSAMWETDEELTNKFTLNEETGAAYASIDYTLNENTGFAGGLRYEYLNSVLSSLEEQGIVDLHYGSFFPSFYFSLNLNENNKIQLSFNRRIDRPTFNELAPFIFFMSPNTYISGNENLVPAFSNLYKFEYKYKIIYLTLGYTSTKDFIARFQPKFNDDKTKQYFISANYDKQNTLSANLTFPFRINEWWSMRNNIQGIHQHLITDFEGENLDLTAYNFRVYTVQNFMISKSLSAELAGYYRSPALSGIYRSRSLGRLDAAIQYSSKDNKSQLSLNVTDVFKTSVYRSSVDIPELNLKSEWINDWEPRNIKLTFRHNFGDKKVKAAGKRKTASEEEQDRIKIE